MLHAGWDMGGQGRGGEAGPRPFSSHRVVIVSCRVSVLPQAHVVQMINCFCATDVAASDQGSTSRYLYWVFEYMDTTL